MYERVLPQIFEPDGFSALQRAEIAEIASGGFLVPTQFGFSALQRAEIAEILVPCCRISNRRSFSALQRAEIAEMGSTQGFASHVRAFQCSSTSRNC